MSCNDPTQPDAGPDAGQPCDAAVQTCHCCAVVTIKELTFSGNNVVEKDTTGNFPAPEWVQGRAQPDQSPISYARNRRIAVSAKFRVTTAACLGSEAVQVRGRATFGSASLEWTGSINLTPADTEATVALTSNNPLPNEVGIFETTDIVWEANVCNQGWTSTGTTRNVLYVTLADPSGSPSYWTLLDISCRAAAGATTENDLVTRSFAPFRSKIGDGNGFRRKRDGVELTYYKMGAGTPSSGVFSCADLLSRADGTGRCGAWARFLVAMHQVHGITSSSVFGVVPIDARLLIVKNCTFAGAGTKGVPFTHAGETECQKNDGIKGQGKNNPQFTFGDHALVDHSTGIYDPSYGVGPTADLLTWETGGIAGIGELPGVSFTYGGDPHFFPGTCSPGFIKYTAVAGDTLATIATKFSVASANALSSHPYNAAFRATHPAARPIAPGEQIIIPRDIARVAILRRR